MSGPANSRLGRMNNTIVREPGTGLPKIPGTSIAGVTRAYMAMREGKYLRPKKNGDGISEMDKEGKPVLESCAGKGGPDGMEHCRLAGCPVCTAFGFSRKGASFQGLAMFTDARILLFPVATMAGPRWVTSPWTLLDAGVFGKDGTVAEEVASKWNSYLCPAANDYRFYSPDTSVGDPLNLGWLYLEKMATEGQPSKLLRASARVEGRARRHTLDHGP